MQPIRDHEPVKHLILALWQQEKTTLTLILDDGRICGLMPGRHAKRAVTAYMQRYYQAFVVSGGRLPDGIGEELELYFSGTATALSYPVQLTCGTAFQQQVWELLRHIPHGTVTTYGRLAAVLGRPAAARAVGAAVGANPVSIYVPCHRVVGADGYLTGYAWGLEWKKRLLELEGVAIRKSGCGYLTSHGALDVADSLGGIR